MKYTYAVFCGGKWGMTTNKRTALSSAREWAKVTLHDAVYVHRMPYTRESWDAPTFRACSDRIATIVASHTL